MSLQEVQNRSRDAVAANVPGDRDNVARFQDGTSSGERQLRCPHVAGLERDSGSDGSERAERDGGEDARELHGGRKVKAKVSVGEKSW